MEKWTRALLLLVTMLLVLGGGLVISACGGGDDTETEVSSRVREAMALLSKPDLSELTEPERELVGPALREALARAGKVRVSNTIDAQDIVFGPDGRVVMMRKSSTAQRQPPEFATPEVGESQMVRVYDGPPAKFCDGREDPEMSMMREYVHEFGEWQVSTKAIALEEVPFESVLSRLDLSVAKDAGFSDEEGRHLRGLSVPFPQPGDPEATLTVWIDLEDGLIRKVVSTLPGVPGSAFPFAFDYDAPIEIEVPSEPSAPDCISAESGG